MNLLDVTGPVFPEFIDSDLLFIGLIILAVLTLLLGVVFPIFEAKDRVKKRAMAIGGSDTRAVAQDTRSASDLQKRRKTIAENLQEVANQNEKKKRLKLDMRIAQAGLEISPPVFMSIAAGVGLVVGGVLYVIMDQILVPAGIAITIAFGLPNWLLNYLRDRRIGKFVYNFPMALETVVRGVRAGLPVNECLNIIAREAPEPVRSEFRILVENLAFGITLGEAAERMAERIPTPETMFFSIVLTIQSQSGGNLGETLGNLSGILRDRKKMREKIGALSNEAKVSAGIIGSMPFIVMLAVYFSNPNYLAVLFTTSSGKLILGGGMLWMMTGVYIMKQMINFDI